MSFTLSPNMSLPIPGVGTEAGPTYAFDVNSSLTLIDQHDHSLGKGAPVTPAGLNINAPLNVQGNNIYNISELTLVNESSPSSTLFTLSASPGGGTGVADLWYTDGTGTQIQMTKNGIVNSTAASIPGESYSAGTFIWTQTQSSLPTTPANFDIGSITIRPNTALTTNGVTLTPPGAIASAYDIALPLLPASQSFLTIDNTGVMAAPVVYPLVAAGIASKTITAAQIADNTITTNQISLTAGITGGQIANTTIAAGNIVANTITTSQVSLTAGITPNQLALSTYSGTSSSSGTFTTTSATNVLVTNLSGITPTSTTQGRPMLIYFTGDEISIYGGTSGDQVTATFTIQGSNGVTLDSISTTTMRFIVTTGGTSGRLGIPATALNCIYLVPAKPLIRLSVKVITSGSAGSATVAVTNVFMTVVQL